MSIDPKPDNGKRPASRVSPTDRRIVERVKGARPGDSIVRVRRPRYAGFSRKSPGHLEAGLEIERPRGPLGTLWRALVGTPIHTEMEQHERLSKKKALAVFSSDALSSVAYAPQEVLVVLLAAGAAALWWSLPISIAVVLLLTIVITSYRQTIYAYPTGGGSYIVAHGNLGQTPGLIAASALSVGYVLTVSVSIASSVDQLVSAVQTLAPYRVWLGVGAVLLVTLANLRGLRESGSIFAVPTYVFLVAMYALIGGGLILLSSGSLHLPDHSVELPPPTTSLSLFLLLRAFATGAAVMTGTEAISDGVLAFQKPEPVNAARTLVTMGAILATMFLGLSFLVVNSGIIPTHNETLISQLATAVFGAGPIYYVVQGSAVLILVLAANTAYADFPRLAFFLARDNYAPHQFMFRGERLAFSNGIILLGVMGALLIILFSGSTGALLPLYALCVFLAFTMSQLGMVQHWRRVRGPRWQLKATINGIGATVTALVALIAAVTNIMNPNLPIIPGLPIGWGSWLIVLIVPLMVMMFRRVNRHYTEADANTALPPAPDEPEGPIKLVVVVPIAKLNRQTVMALRYAASMSQHVTAVHVTSDAEKADELEAQWETWGQGVPLVVIESPYRSLSAPLLHFLAELKREEQADILTVVLPEYVPDSWWEHLLHGQSAQFLKFALLFRPGFVVTSIPYHENGLVSGAQARSEQSRSARAE